MAGIAYTIWLTIKITHEYYAGKSNGLCIKPAPNTQEALTKAGIIVKQADSCTWNFLRRTDTDEVRMAGLPSQLEFYVVGADEKFYYCTDTDTSATGEGWRLEDKGGMWKLLTVEVMDDKTARRYQVEITLSSKKKFLEIIVFPTTGREYALVLKDDSGRIAFNGSRIDFPGETYPVYRFISTEKVSLRAAYNYNIALWEQKTNGQVMLTRNIAVPKPDSASILSLQDTISSYFYF